MSKNSPVTPWTCRNWAAELHKKRWWTCSIKYGDGATSLMVKLKRSKKYVSIETSSANVRRCSIWLLTSCPSGSLLVWTAVLLAPISQVGTNCAAEPWCSGFRRFSFNDAADFTQQKLINCTFGGFLKWGGIPKSSILVEFSLTKTIQLLGYPQQ